MTSIARTFGLLALTSLGFLVTTGGCSNVGETIDCAQMCEKMETCIDGDLDVSDCIDRCEERADDNALADKLDACTDCLDRDYSCSEIVDECSVCDEVQVALER